MDNPHTPTHPNNAPIPEDDDILAFIIAIKSGYLSI